MKKNYFLSMLALTALAMGFTSCNNDDEATGQAGQKATLVINVASPESRASGTAAPSGDATINKFSVFVFDGAGNLEERKNVPSAATTATMSNVTTSAKDVYVIANADAAAIPATVNTKSKLEAFIVDLNGTYKQTASRWATGKNATALSFTQNGTAFEASTTITMKFISARFTVKVVPMADYDNTKADGSLILTDVLMLNAGGASKLFAPSLVPSAAELTAASLTNAYYAGMSMPAAFTYKPTNYGVAATLVGDAVTSVSKTDFASKVFYYYGFENLATTAATYPTILVVKGTYDGKDVYYPVHLTGYEQFKTGTMTASVLRGNSYDVTITLTGKADITTGGTYPGDTGGGEDPTEPIVKASVSVNLDITDWNPVVLNKEF